MSTISKSVTHFLVIQQDINKEVTRDVQHQLEVVQTIDWSLDGSGVYERVVRHELTVDQLINFVYDLEVEHVLAVQQTIEQHGVLPTKHVEHDLRGTLAQIITVDDSGIQTDIHAVEHQLTVEQWVGGEGKTPFVDPEIPTFEGTKAIEHQLNVQQFVGVHASSTLASGPGDRRFIPNPGGLGTATGPNRNTFHGSSSLVMKYPHPDDATPTNEITLPSPLFGNREEVQVSRIQRKSAGGNLFTFADSQWPISRFFKVAFDSLTDAQRTDLFTFLAASLGRPIQLIDHDGTSWSGILTNPNGDVATFNQVCGHTAEFIFLVIKSSQRPSTGPAPDDA